MTYNLVMLNQPVLFLDEIDLSDSPNVGPKAATLGLLRQSGLPVPNGFVIPATALRQFVVENELARAVTELEALARRAPELVAGSPLLEQVSEAFLHGQKFTRWSTDLRRAFNALNAETGSVAVRSSAIAEDRAEASFAGQQLSVLNVRTFPDLIRAIWRTWASLFSPTAVQYRARFARGDELPAMAVLVQAQIICDAAGTMFTVDPVTGQRRIVIEATWGLGEAIAQGEVEPDRYWVDPKTLADAAPAQVGNKRCQRVLSEREGTRLTTVPEWRRQDPVLTTSQRGALALLGLQVEQILDSPQDLEWGLAGGRWWIFQSRPITTYVSTEEREPADLERFDWTSGFLDERLVEPVSPLGWSVLREGMEEIAFRAPLRMLGVDLNELGPLTRLWNGHPYTNVAVFESLYKLFPDWLLPEDARRFFPGGDVSRRERASQPRSILSPTVWLSLARGFFGDLPAASPIQNPVTWAYFEREYRTKLDRLDEQVAALERESRTGEDVSLSRVLSLVDDVQCLNRRLLEIHRWSLTHGEVLYSLLRRLATRLYGPRKAAAFAADVVQNLDDQSMHLNQALADLAQIDSTSETSVFQAKLSDFLARFGHRSFTLDLLRPSFAADSSQVINLIQVLRADPQMIRPDDGKSSSAKSRSGWSILWPLAYLTRRYARLREDQRFAWQRGMALLRRLYLLAGLDLTRRGMIRRTEDVFFLVAEEVRASVETPTESFAERIAARSRRFAADTARFAANSRASYPPFLRGNQPFFDSPESVEARALRGVAVSPGLGRGRARVITRADELARVRPDEVLVTRGADPAWTVVFGELAALITESGGQLSHAAVAAREYHLPAVLGVSNATKIIRTGDEVLVDGTSGQIVILNRV